MKSNPRLQTRQELATKINAGNLRTEHTNTKSPPGRTKSHGAEPKNRAGRIQENIQKSVALEDLEFKGLRAQQILKGRKGTIAVIGRTMGNETRAGVLDYGKGLSKLGYKTELFDGKNISPTALDEFQQLAADAKQEFVAGLRENEYLTTDEVKQTLLYKENVAWATKLKAQSYTVIDLGNPYNLTNSAFYDAEKDILFK